MRRKWLCDLREQAEQGTGFKRVKDWQGRAVMMSDLPEDVDASRGAEQPQDDHVYEA